MNFVDSHNIALLKGRSNLALTVMVPNDCDNACSFCTSKKEYSRYEPNKTAVLDMVDRFFNKECLTVDEMVVTGGEPMNDISFLEQLVDKLPGYVKVYINTSFIKKNLNEFIRFVNEQPQVKGVNISRHTGRYEDDCKYLCNIAEDEKIKEIDKPVRINCVIGDDTSLIDRIIDRWKGFENVEISFRADFTKVDKDRLHIPFCKVNNYLSDRFEYIGHTQCDVCDTTSFKTESGMAVKYHRGLRTTSIIGLNSIQVNDFVLRQDGKLFIDWDFKKEDEVTCRMVPPPVIPFFNDERYINIRSCGGSACGGGLGPSFRCDFNSCGGGGC